MLAVLTNKNYQSMIDFRLSFNFYKNFYKIKQNIWLKLKDVWKVGEVTTP